MDQPSAEHRVRVRVFVDFWNFQLSLNQAVSDFKPDWAKLGHLLAREALQKVDDEAHLSYQGMNVYGSYGENPPDRRLKDWAEKHLARMPGVRVEMLPRQRKRRGPRCPSCYKEVSTCPACSADMRGTEEKGIDTHIATAMISLAWKVPKAQILVDTVLQGVERGLLVGRQVRPDGSDRTWWRQPVDPAAREDPALAVCLPEHTELSRLFEGLLAPGVLPELWGGAEDDRPAPDRRVTLGEVAAYFGGGRVVRVPQDGYDEPYTIPRCSDREVREAVNRAVEQGIVWLTYGPTSVWKEPIPYGALEPGAVLRPAPEPIAAHELTQEALPGAYKDGRVNAISLTQALSRSRGEALPWGLVRDAIENAAASRWLRLSDGSTSVNCGYEAAGGVLLERPGPDPDPPPVDPPAAAGAVLEGAQIQDLAEQIPKLLSASAGADLRFHVRVVLDGDLPHGDRSAVDELLAEVADDLKASPDPKDRR